MQCSIESIAADWVTSLLQFEVLHCHFFVWQHPAIEGQVDETPNVDQAPAYDCLIAWIQRRCCPFEGQPRARQRAAQVRWLKLVELRHQSFEKGIELGR